MQNLIQEIIVYGPVYLVMTLITFLNVIVPVSGSSTQTPLIAAITGDAHYAVTISSWLLMISCGMLAFVFRKDINKDYFWKLLPMSVIGAIIGASLVIQLPNWLVSLILVVSAIRFLYKKTKHFLSKNKQKNEEKKNAHHIVVNAVGLFSSFLQGMGLSGGWLRSSFLYSENLKLEQVRGTAERLNFIIFAIAGLVRFNENQLSLFDMFKWTIIFSPLLFISIYLGRKSLLKLSDKVKDGIIILIMLYATVRLTVKIMETFF